MADVTSEMVERVRTAAKSQSITIEVDSLVSGATPTYSVTMKAPSSTEIVLSAQTAAQVAASLTEFTNKIAAIW